MQPALAAATATVALLLVFGLAQAKFDHEKAKKNFEACKEQTGADETYEQTVVKQVIPTSEKGICLVECMMKKKGFYDDDGKYNKQAVVDYMKKVLEGRANADEQLKTVEQIVDECVKSTDVEGLDKCEVAVKHTTCFKVKADKAGIKLPEEPKKEEASS